MNLKKRYRDIYDQFISLKGTPESIAFGAAIGVFIGVTPTMPFHTISIFALTFFLRLNFTTAFLGATAISNPLTIPFLYASQYQLGKYLLGNEWCEVPFTDYSIWDIMNAGWNIACPLLLGGLIMALVFAVPAYFMAYRAVVIIRGKRHGHSHGDP
ncbi:MAG: DUF2062 domain-containing protein [Deltaproteobacteria bacterium]|nr:DUF2062 domain-containing protein [Deltaproteobacteria bacterium]